MDQQDFDALDRRILARAERLWQDAGSPEGDRDRYLENARELVAMAEVPLPTLDPETAADPVIEEASLLRNLGEFPTLRDQGDEQAFPQTDTAQDDHDIRGSDGDSSEDGGALPEAHLPEQDLPDVPEADGDITSDWPYPQSDLGPQPQLDDINDDGRPDQPSMPDQPPLPDQPPRRQ